MSKKRVPGWVQNLALILLAGLAVFLVTRLFLFHGTWPDRVPSALAAPSPAVEEGQVQNLSCAVASVHIMVTGDIEYGRYGQLHAAGEAPLLQQSLPLFREALGSAGQMGATADGTFREALDSPGIYLELAGQLPLAAVAAWLGEDTGFDRNVQSMALTTEAGDNASLYLRSADGVLCRFDTALPSSAVQALCETVAPNGSCFAYETGYASLASYSLLVPEVGVPPDVQAELPAGYSAYNLLTALDFNAYTNYRYTESSSGTEVVEESPRTLRIGPDGSVSCISGAEVAAALFRVPASGPLPSAEEALNAAGRLAEALYKGTGAAPLYLKSMEGTENGWTIRFRCQVDGIPVFFSDEEDALTVAISGRVITAFTYRCRAYTALDPDYAEGGEGSSGGAKSLLPASMAAAIAALYPEGSLSIGYEDSGSGILTAQWLGS